MTGQPRVTDKKSCQLGQPGQLAPRGTDPADGPPGPAGPGNLPTDGNPGDPADGPGANLVVAGPRADGNRADGNPTSGGRPRASNRTATGDPAGRGANHEADGPAGPRTANLRTATGASNRGSRRTAPGQRWPPDGNGYGQPRDVRADGPATRPMVYPLGPTTVSYPADGQLAPILDCETRYGTVQLAPGHSHNVASDTAPRTLLAKDSHHIHCTAPTRTLVQLQYGVRRQPPVQ